MKNQKRLSIFVAMCLCVSFTACTQNDDHIENVNTTASVVSKVTEPQTTEQTTIENITEAPITKNLSEQPITEDNNVELNNTYTTKLTEIDNVTYPAFSFDYPDNWTVVKEAVVESYELVTLENESGAVIWFSHINGKKGEDIGGGSSTNMARIDVSEISESQFVPDAANKNLGEFMVAKLKITGVLDMRTDSDYTDIDGDISYAVLPKSEVGLREGVNKAIPGEFTFYYGANISFVGTDTDNDFTDVEQQEVIEILNSFRLA